MNFRTPAQVQAAFLAHPRRALIITVLPSESRAVSAHLSDTQILMAGGNRTYHYANFSDPAGDWLIVHAITPQGNTEAGLVASKAHQDFGPFHVQLFVGIAGSLKDDIPIGSVVIGDYVYNGHSAKVEDRETYGRPHSLTGAPELLDASRELIYLDDWKNFIRATDETDIPTETDYPCAFPPEAFIKGIVSGEEVVAGTESARYTHIRSHFNDCGAIEMEGWGAMSAAHYERTPAIIVRGISDMCAGKFHATDKLHQPIAAIHAAAFAFSILSYRSKAPAPEPLVTPQAPGPDAQTARRVEVVFHFEGSAGAWSQERTEAVVQCLREVLKDDNLTVVRIDDGSVRLVLKIRQGDLEGLDIPDLRAAASNTGVKLLGAVPMTGLRQVEEARQALSAASADLLAWETTLPDGTWIARPEQREIEDRFQLDASSTVLLGEPGLGKSSLLSRIASELAHSGATVFAVKADLLSPAIETEPDLQHELQLPAPPSELILSAAAFQPVFVFIDQLDALASQLDLKSARLNVLLNLVRRIGGTFNVHVLLSARTFEFQHDVRLRAIEAERVTLTPPPLHVVRERLAEVGVELDEWPEKARDVVLNPQALKTFIGLAASGRQEPYTTYQAMLEQLWRDRVASSTESKSLIALASDLAESMAEEEALWLATSRFDDRMTALDGLEALGFIVRSENRLSVAFSHQTIFDYVLARTFVRNARLLSTYVLERQDSLFVRAKLWSALNYLRQTEATSYERELLELWRVKELRRHLRFLLIEFLGHTREPREFEKACMSEILRTPDLRMVGLRAIGSDPAWFSHLAPVALPDAMSGSDSEARQALRILNLHWKTDCERVVRLIKDYWLPHPEKDRHSWTAVHECPHWTEAVEDIARTILNRTAISPWEVTSTATALAIDQSDVAIRLVAAKLDQLSAEIRAQPGPPPFPENGSDDEQILWHVENQRAKSLTALLEATDWHELPSLAEAAPAAFLRHLWPWYLSVFSELITSFDSPSNNHLYPGHPVLDVEFSSSDGGSSRRERPLLTALQVAIERVAVNAPSEFLNWGDAQSGCEIQVVQQLIARGYEVAVDQLASQALTWLLLDPRRFQLGTGYRHRRTTMDLVKAAAPHWSKDEIARLEDAAVSYQPPPPDNLEDPRRRKRFASEVRATRRDLLQALGSERLTPENRELLATEERALGDRFDRSMSEVQGGFIGSPMEATAMAKAKDRDILNIFRQIPDSFDWHHPKDWMRGGNIPLSRAFAQFARSYPDRAIDLIGQFEPSQQERAAGYALDAMAEDPHNDTTVLELFLDLQTRGFRADEFKESAARAVEKIGRRRKGNVPDEVIEILCCWLNAAPDQSEERRSGVGDSRSIEKEKTVDDESIIWNSNHIFFLPGGDFSTLSALASILLNRSEAGRDRYIEILGDHLRRDPDPDIWKALLYRLGNAGGSTPSPVSNFVRRLFARLPEILESREAVLFFAHAQRWDDRLVFDLISDWRESELSFSRRAYGELVGLISVVKQKSDWVLARDHIIASGDEAARAGLAHAAVNTWPNQALRQSANDVLLGLLTGASKRLVATVMDVFRVTDELTLDPPTVALLRRLADGNTDMSGVSSDFVVGHLQQLLPHEPDLIAAIAEELVIAWRSDLGDLRTGRAAAAPQLTDLALTLHRLGGAARESGMKIFEALIEIDAFGARETLAEIDGRFRSHKEIARPRVGRRRQRPEAGQ